MVLVTISIIAGVNQLISRGHHPVVGFYMCIFPMCYKYHLRRCPNPNNQSKQVSGITMTRMVHLLFSFEHSVKFRVPVLCTINKVWAVICSNPKNNELQAPYFQNASEQYITQSPSKSLNLAEPLLSVVSVFAKPPGLIENVHCSRKYQHGSPQCLTILSG